MKDLLKLLCIGDVIGQPGCDFLREKLPRFKQDYQIDLVIANGENSAIGNGILPVSANFLLDSGVDVITTGNHVFKRREIYTYLDETPQVIRPANFLSKECPGNGYYLYEHGGYQLCVINLIGLSFMEPAKSPFQLVDEILAQVKADCYVVDFHAEASGEKKAMGYYLDGRVSLVCGTHTHIQTADEQILPKGTGYITDLGMTGPIHSVLGVNPAQVIEKLRTGMPVRFQVPDSPCALDGVVVEIDVHKKNCTSITRIHLC